LKNKNTLPGEILQCCQGASYILLATWKNTLGYQKPLGYDSKLNVLNSKHVLFCHVQCVLYSKPSGRILKLYFYSVVGKFLRDFFHGDYEMLILSSSGFCLFLAGSDQNSAQIASGK
jgi:hypothetical protein